MNLDAVDICSARHNRGRRGLTWSREQREQKRQSEPELVHTKRFLHKHSMELLECSTLSHKVTISIRCRPDRTYSREVTYAQTDVRRREDLTSLVNLACERYGQLDVLIKNAGIGPISPVDDLRVEDWENMIDINIKGVLYGIAAALPVFRKQGFGHFVNTASTAGIIVHPNMAVYGRHDLRGLAPGGGRQVARDDHFTGLREHELHGIHDRA